MTGVSGAHGVGLKLKRIFFYSLTPSKELRLVSFHKKVNLQKLDFYPIFGVKLLLGFFAFLRQEIRVRDSSILEVAF